MNSHKISTEKIQLSVIILFYYGERWIKQCIESLERQSLSRKAYELILVDNGGSTPSVGKYNKQSHTKVLYFTENQGFAGGNNMALAHAEGEYILLMNQDVVVHFKCLEEMVSAFTSYPQAGVISANMVMISSNNNIDPYGTPSKVVGLYRLTRLGYALYFTKPNDENMVPAEFVSGNALCFRRSILVAVGNYLFDERLGSYAEDLDLSLRLKKTKWQMYVRPQAVVYHYRNQAFVGSPAHMLRKLFQVSSNRLLVYYNNLPIRAFLIKLPALLLGIPCKVTRPDGAHGFNLLNFLVALGFLPFIFAYFGLRALQISQIEISKSDTT